MNKKKIIPNKINISILSSLAFTLMLSYSIARPTIESLFLKHHSSNILPYAWIITGFCSFIVVIIYNKFNNKYSLMYLFFYGSILSGTILAILMPFYSIQPKIITFILYIWKEIYVIILVEIFWSFSALIFNMKSATKIYGIFLVVGTTGATIGNLLVSQIVDSLGTFAILWFVLPLLLIGSLIALFINKIFNINKKIPSSKSHTNSNITESIKTLWKSKYLVPLFILVCIVQMSTTIIEYQYNTILQESYPLLDSRTNISSQIQALINVLSYIAQIFTNYIIRLLSITGSLIITPILLFICTIIFISIPKFITIVILRVISKSSDYSIFRAAKELLYIPLSRKEITQGKSLIDVFGFRSAKGISSILVIILLEFKKSYLIIPSLTILQLAWIIITAIIIKRFKEIKTKKIE